MLHHAQQDILKPFNNAVESDFHVLLNDWKWKFHPVVVSFFCNTPESKDMKGVRQGRASHSCAQCLSTCDDIF